MGILKRLRFLPPLLAAWLGAGALPAAAAGPQVPVLQVGGASSPSGSATARLVLDGHLEPVRQATVAAQIGGNVVQLAVKAGDKVRSGQLLARVDERDTQAGLQRSEASLAQAEAVARNARVHLDRTRELRAQGFVSQAALDAAETDARAAQAGVQQAQSGRTQAQLARNHAQLTAPFDGIVLATHVDTGDLAAPGRAVVTVYAPGALRAVVQVPASRLAQARQARQVEVELPDGRRVKPARVTELALADPVAQTVEWRLDLPNTRDGTWRPGLAVRVHFLGASVPPSSTATATPAAEEPARAASWRLPAAAVLRRGELTAVYVAQGQAFTLRAVRLGADLGAAGIEVVAGLRAGERIATDALRAGLAGASPASPEGRP